jgi:hypothetical protein
MKQALCWRAVVLGVSTSCFGVALLADIPAWIRLALVVAGAVPLFVRGSWADVMMLLLVVLAIAGVVRSFIAPDAPLAEPVKLVAPASGTVRIALDKGKLDAPQRELAAGTAAQLAVVFVDNKATKSLVFHVTLPAAVPTAPGDDVLVDYGPTTDKKTAQFVGAVKIATSFTLIP